jgi:hypothetical protein
LIGSGISKHKKKKKVEPNLEFVSPYPLEDCVWQLQNFPGVGEWFPVRTKVDLAQVDGETWEFRIIKSYYSLGFLEPRRNSRNQNGSGLVYPDILAEGKLIATDLGTTLVTGTVCAKRKMSLMGVGFLLAVILVIVLFSGHLPALTATFVTILMVLIFSMFLIVSILFGVSDNDQRFANAMKGHIKGVLGN